LPPADELESSAARERLLPSIMKTGARDTTDANATPPRNQYQAALGGCFRNQVTPNGSPTNTIRGTGWRIEKSLGRTLLDEGDTNGAGGASDVRPHAIIARLSQ